MTAYGPWNAVRASALIAEHSDREGPLLPILHALQEEFGYIDEAAEPMIAEALNISRAEVHGVVTFYHDFRQRAGRQACAEALPRGSLPGGGRRCARGARRSKPWRCNSANTTADGRVTLEPVYCLGLCSVSPSAMLDGRIVGRLDEKKLDALLAEAQPMSALRIYIPGDAPPSRAAPTRSRRARGVGRRSASSTSRSSATARAACIGSSRCSRSRPARAASLTARSNSPMSRACSTR